MEALEDDSIFINTSGKRYYIRPKDAVKPGVTAWLWATRLCQLSQLLGHEVTGHVAACAYGLRVAGSEPFSAPYVPSKSAPRAMRPHARAHRCCGRLPLRVDVRSARSPVR